MSLRLAACLIVAALLAAPRPVAGAQAAVAVPGGELPAPGADPADLARLRALIWERVARHYVAEQGLAATAAELAELMHYHSEFERRDRRQRARKLEELEQRLAADGLAPGERAHLMEFRAVLARLARLDAERDRDPPADPDREAAFYAPWIELWKANKALYERYGGTVVLTELGPAPYGAQAALIEEYERRGLVRFFDARLRERLLAQPPPSTMVVPPDRVDFTPYWKLPIPPSYFPD